MKKKTQRRSARLELTVLPPLGETSAKSAPDRLQILARLDGAQVVGELRTSGGAAGEAWRQIIAAHESLRAHLGGDRGKAPAAEQIRWLGQQLFSLLFTGRVRALYEEARRARSVELVFHSLVPWIADKPWELMRDPRRGFVARGKVRFSRSAPTDIPARAPKPQRGAMRVLIAVAEPRGEARLSWEKESAAIAEGFAPLERQGLLRATLIRAATLKGLRAALQGERFDVLHFVGHGGWDKERDRGYLLFEGEKGDAAKVSSGELVRLLRGRALRLLVLNACETGRGSRRGIGVDFNRGVAPALLAAGLPAVLANQYAVFDRPAIAFAQKFYAALGRGRSLSDAMQSARVSIARSRGDGDLEWAVPVLYARDPAQRLCPRTSPSPERAARAAKRQTKAISKAVEESVSKAVGEKSRR